MTNKMVRQSISEKEMVDTYVQNLKKEKGNKIVIFKEVKNFQKRIDIVELPRRKNGLGIAHAIEFKVFNWREGFKQALGNRVLMPYNSLAIWDEYKDKVIAEELRREGIGFIVINKNKNKIMFSPKRSPYLIHSTYNKIRSELKTKID